MTHSRSATTIESPIESPESAETPTGRMLARQRLALGLSISAVARAMGAHPYHLARLERDDSPLTAARLQRWQAALRTCATRRAHALQREGWTLGMLPHDLRATLALYTAPDYPARH